MQQRSLIKQKQRLNKSKYDHTIQNIKKQVTEDVACAESDECFLRLDQGLLMNGAHGTYFALHKLVKFT